MVQPLAYALELPAPVVTVSLVLPGALLLLFGLLRTTRVAPDPGVASAALLCLIVAGFFDLTHPERWLRDATRKLEKDAVGKAEPEIRAMCDAHVETLYEKCARFWRSVHHAARQLSMDPEEVLRTYRRMLCETLLQSSRRRA